MVWSAVRNNERAIIHLNVADFAVAVERLVDVRLRGRPVVIAAPGAARAAVYDMSDEAYRTGVRKGMALRRAQRLCRDLRVVPPRPDRYERAMRFLWDQARPYSPLIEAGSGDGHLFLDLTGTGRLFGPPPDVAWRLRRGIRAELGLDPIWSAAPNKLVAKTASRVVKPTGEYIVDPGEEEDFLRPLPLAFLPGLEREDLICFRDFHISKVEQAGRWSPEQLEAVFGRRGRHIYRTVRGIDQSPVLAADGETARVSAEHEFGDDTNEAGLVEAVLYRLAETAGAELRRRGLAARRVGLTLDYTDGRRVVRQASDRRGGTASDFRLFDLAKTALALAWTRRVRLRRLKMVSDRLTYPPSQLELFPEDEQKSQADENLLAALDRIRRRFGRDLIRWGRTQAVEA